MFLESLISLKDYLKYFNKITIALSFVEGFTIPTRARDMVGIVMSTIFGTQDHDVKYMLWDLVHR